MAITLKKIGGQVVIITGATSGVVSRRLLAHQPSTAARCAELTAGPG